MPSWTRVNGRAHAIGQRQKGDEQGGQIINLALTMESLSIIRAEATGPMESNHCCYQQTTTHKHTRTTNMHTNASNCAHPRPYLHNTLTQKTPEHSTRQK